MDRRYRGADRGEGGVWVVRNTADVQAGLQLGNALIARRAAYAEELDPETPSRNCRVCGGETVCV